jgi:hypothetical protein
MALLVSPDGFRALYQEAEAGLRSFYPYRINSAVRLAGSMGGGSSEMDMFGSEKIAG